jgi:hypothetical protein
MDDSNPLALPLKKDEPMPEDSQQPDALAHDEAEEGDGDAQPRFPMDDDAAAAPDEGEGDAQPRFPMNDDAAAVDGDAAAANGSDGSSSETGTNMVKRQLVRVFSDATSDDMKDKEDIMAERALEKEEQAERDGRYVWSEDFEFVDGQPTERLWKCPRTSLAASSSSHGPGLVDEPNNADADAASDAPQPRMLDDAKPLTQGSGRSEGEDELEEDGGTWYRKPGPTTLEELQDSMGNDNLEALKNSYIGNLFANVEEKLLKCGVNVDSDLSGLLITEDCVKTLDTLFTEGKHKIYEPGSQRIRCVQGGDCLPVSKTIALEFKEKSGVGPECFFGNVLERMPEVIREDRH